MHQYQHWNWLLGAPQIINQGPISSANYFFFLFFDFFTRLPCGWTLHVATANQTHLLLILLLHGKRSHSTCSALQAATDTWQSPPFCSSTPSQCAGSLWEARRVDSGRSVIVSAGGCSSVPPTTSLGNVSWAALSASVTGGTLTPVRSSRKPREPDADDQQFLSVAPTSTFESNPVLWGSRQVLKFSDSLRKRIAMHKLTHLIRVEDQSESKCFMSACQSEDQYI